MTTKEKKKCNKDNERQHLQSVCNIKIIIEITELKHKYICNTNNVQMIKISSLQINKHVIKTTHSYLKKLLIF